MLRKELDLPLTDSTFWTDSTSVLKYIHNQTKRFHTFVSNRVAVIHDLSRTSQWRYINSRDNPADDASRGLHVESYLRSRWLRGPEYLGREKNTWPKITQGLGKISANDPEVKKEVTVNSVRIENQHPIGTLIKYHSWWNRLQRSVAWILKVKKLLQLLSQIRKGQTRVFGDEEKTERWARDTKPISGGYGRGREGNRLFWTKTLLQPWIYLPGTRQNPQFKKHHPQTGSNFW